MNPHQKNKVDVKSLTPEEQRLFRLYGKLPSRSDHFAKHLKDRKYFDSGDYAMSKAGKGDGVDAGAVGSQHPHAHHGSVPGIQAGSPIKESSFLKSETSADETEGNDADKSKDADAAIPEPVTAGGEGIPIRR
ncbi:Endosulphine [Fusarium oxysporum f. sp. vasinfectum]|nr:Endosulphine [Fusarium oxysporum f. sp. vasinfectum]WKT44671.1 Endosulphine [Fusarium oxysporum f. sp. vasinfectum]